MWPLLKETINKWLEDRAQTHGAALAYYSVFSLAPLLVLIVAVAGLIFGRDAFHGDLISSIGNFVGQGPAQSIQDMLKTDYMSSSGKTASVLGGIGALVGASAMFIQLQDSLNSMWGVKPRPGRGISDVIKERFFSFVMVLCAGLVVMAFLVATIAISALSAFFKDSALGSETLWHGVNAGAAFIIFTLIFAFIFKYVPDAKTRWSDVWRGAALTSVLFVIGKLAIGLYIGKSGATTAYGAAGSLALLLLWIYYSAQILFLGAEFTHVYSRQCHGCVEPADNAIKVEDAERKSANSRTGRAVAVLKPTSAEQSVSSPITRSL